jgi:hypothetical protein
MRSPARVPEKGESKELMGEKRRDPVHGEVPVQLRILSFHPPPFTFHLLRFTLHEPRFTTHVFRLVFPIHAGYPIMAFLFGIELLRGMPACWIERLCGFMGRFSFPSWRQDWERRSPRNYPLLAQG